MNKYLLISGIIIFIIIIIFYASNKYNIESFNNNKTHKVHAVKAISVESKNKGLMYRKKGLSDNEAMLFYYNDGIDRKHCVWMKNTFIPLDIIFLDASYKVIDYKENLVPHNLTNICSSVLARHFIEVKHGYIKDNNVIIGDNFDIHIIKK